MRRALGYMLDLVRRYAGPNRMPQRAGLAGPEDPRQSGKVWYPLDEVLCCACWLAPRAGSRLLSSARRSSTFCAASARSQRARRRTISSVTLFAALDAEAFQRCFISWVASLTKFGPDIVVIDGKTLRRAYQEGGAKAPIHMISAWSASSAGVRPAGRWFIDHLSNTPYSAHVRFGLPSLGGQVQN